MKILDKYLVKRFASLCLFILIIAVSIYIIVDFFEKIDNFLAEEVGISDIFHYYLYKLPLILSQMLPVAVLLSTIIMISQLSKYNEIAIIKSCGISILRFSLPLILTTTIISLVSFLANEYLIPITTKKANDIYAINIKKEQMKGIQQISRIWYHSADNIFWNIEYFEPEKSTMNKVKIFIFDENKRLKTRIDAKLATWRDGTWIFNDAIKRIFEPDGSIKTTFDKIYKDEAFSETPNDFKKLQKKGEEMSFSELINYIKKIEIEGFDSTRYKVDLHSKITFPLISIIMCIVGIPFSLRSERNWGITFGIGVSFIIGFSYWIIFSLGISLGRVGILPPFLAAWGAAFIFFFGGIYLLLTVRQ